MQRKRLFLLFSWVCFVVFLDPFAIGCQFPGCVALVCCSCCLVVVWSDVRVTTLLLINILGVEIVNNFLLKLLAFVIFLY